MADTQPGLKVGCILPLSGAEHVHARSQLLAVQLAFEEHHQSDQQHLDVELVVEDDEVDPERAAQIARDLVADERVLAVIGPMNSVTAMTAAPVFHEAGLAHVATAASNPSLTEQGWNTFFRVVVNDVHQSRDAARFAVEILGARRLAVGYTAGDVPNDPMNSFSIPVAQGFRDVAEALGAEVTALVGISTGKSDYRSEIQALAGAAPDLIFFVLGEETAPAIASALRAAGVMAPYLATDGLKPFPYFATLDYDVDGPYYINVCADPNVNSRAGEMVQRYIRRFGEEPTVYMAEAYDAAALVLRVLEDANPEHLTRDGVRAGLAATKEFIGTSGVIGFDSKGDLLQPQIGIYRVEGQQLKFLGFTKDLLPA